MTDSPASSALPGLLHSEPVATRGSSQPGLGFPSPVNPSLQSKRTFFAWLPKVTRDLNTVNQNFTTPLKAVNWIMKVLSSRKVYVRDREELSSAGSCFGSSQLSAVNLVTGTREWNVLDCIRQQNLGVLPRKWGGGEVLDDVSGQVAAAGAWTGKARLCCVLLCCCSWEEPDVCQLCFFVLDFL